jgi:hypothetical protein
MNKSHISNAGTKASTSLQRFSAIDVKRMKAETICQDFLSNRSILKLSSSDIHVKRISL